MHRVVHDQRKMRSGVGGGPADLGRCAPILARENAQDTRGLGLSGGLIEVHAMGPLTRGRIVFLPKLGRGFRAPVLFIPFAAADEISLGFTRLRASSPLAGAGCDTDRQLTSLRRQALMRRTRLGTVHYSRLYRAALKFSRISAGTLSRDFGHHVLQDRRYVPHRHCVSTFAPSHGHDPRGKGFPRVRTPFQEARSVF